jgi:hypothetical protein
MFRCMRINIRLDDDLLREAKRHAAATGQTLTTVIEGALREKLRRRRHRSPSQRIRLRTVGGAGTYPGVELDDRSALLDQMDRA